MTHVSKKIKRDAGNSMDPFDEKVLEFDVHEYIWQHLNGADLLKASEVSGRWNKKVESSKGFIEKIKLTITKIPSSAEAEGAVTRSMSRSSNNELTADDTARSRRKFIEALLNSKRNYVNIEIKFEVFSFEVLKQLLRKLAGSIKYMACDRCFHNVYTNVIFPKLTQLEMTEKVTRFQSFEQTYIDLLPLMPAVETLLVDTLSSGELKLIRCKSKSLKEVRCKRTLDVSSTRARFLTQVNLNVKVILTK